MKTKLLVIFALLGATINALSSSVHLKLMNGDEADQQFSRFISRHGRNYKNMPELSRRRDLFRKAYNEI